MLSSHLKSLLFVLIPNQSTLIYNFMYKNFSDLDQVKYLAKNERYRKSEYRRHTMCYSYNTVALRKIWIIQKLPTVLDLLT